MKHNYNKKLDIPQGANSVRYFIPEGYIAKFEDGVLIVEPKESEDEKIRKHIVTFIIEADRRGEAPEECAKWLAYLEKQKDSPMPEDTVIFQKGVAEGRRLELEEQKPFPKFKVGDTIHCKYDDREFTIKSVDLTNMVYKYTKEGCGNDIDYADEDFELVEQKPDVKDPFDDEQFRHGYEAGKHDAMREQKSEWSEEDEINLKIAIGKFEGTNCDLEWDLEQRVIKWLKSLPERFNLQPKQE